jgi:hypothetical protein
VCKGIAGATAIKLTGKVKITRKYRFSEDVVQTRKYRRDRGISNTRE